MSLIVNPYRYGGGGGGGINPPWANVVSLLHFDGADGSTTFTDQKGKTWAPNGNAQIDTAQYKFGGASGLFDGTGDYISTLASTDFDFGSGDFTIEAFVRTNNTPGAGNYRTISSRDNLASPSNRGWLFLLNGDTGGRLAFSCRVGTTAYNVTMSTTLTLSTWYHVAVVRDGGTLRLYADGVQVASSAISGALNSPSEACLIGSFRNGGDTGGFWNGHIDELRITKGVALYTSDFTPPAAPFPNS